VPVRRLGGLIAVITVVLLTATGCISLIQPPPAELISLADQLEADLREVSGVADAETEVHPTDIRDRPGEWYTTAKVTAAEPDDLPGLAARVRAVVKGYETDLGAIGPHLSVPAGAGLTAAELSTVRPEAVARAQAARAWTDFASTIRQGSNSDITVSVRQGLTLPTVLARAREHVLSPNEPPRAITFLWGEGNGTNLTSVTANATSPGPQLAAALEALRVDPAVEYVSADFPITGARPNIYIGTETPAGARSILSGVPWEENGEPARWWILGQQDGTELSGSIGSAAVDEN
jgi:hypothetical protein